MYLLDTNVVSELRKAKTGQANPDVAAWANTAAPEKLYLSTITVLELEIGMLLIDRHDPIQGALTVGFIVGYCLRSPIGFSRLIRRSHCAAQRCMYPILTRNETLLSLPQPSSMDLLS